MSLPVPESIAAADAPPAALAAPGFGAARVVLRPRKARPFFGRHPWVLDSAVARVEGSVADGDVVELVSDTGKFIARGLYNSRSRLRVRLYTWDVGEPLDEPCWKRRIATAVAARRRIGYDDPAGGARLVYSEADGLSGLVVDRFADCLAVQVNALAMAVRLPAIVAALVELVRPRAIVARTEPGLLKTEGLDPPSGVLHGALPDGTVFVVEHGLKYGLDLVTGQKTGFYLDQRENRRAAASYARGRRVLDLFCYSGGFSLAAARLGQAAEVLGIDGSARAVALAEANAALNGISNVHFREQDCFDALDQLAFHRERFGMVVLDPPKFTRNRASVDDALRAYHRVNRRAVDVLEPGGILVTCSCSGSVSREDLLHVLSGVAQQTGRDIQVLEQRGAAPDHPVSATCLEGEYLKCFVCRVL
jgi:23S rRNA (cytosine1962-C5)-methyltransferase